MDGAKDLVKSVVDVAKSVGKTLVEQAKKNPSAAGLAIAALSTSILQSAFRRVGSLPIRGSVSVVSGGSAGIGLAIARELAANGAKTVVILARTQSALDKAADSINADYPGVVVPFRLDCSDFDAVQAAAASILKAHGPIDFLVNNAGVGRWRTLFEMDHAEIMSCLSAPLLCSVFLTKAFLPSMLARDKGHIIAVQSPASRISIPGATMYSTSRWALRGFIESLRSDLRATGLLVQEITLGETNSSYWSNNEGSRERVPLLATLFPVMTEKQSGQAVVAGIRSGEPRVSAPSLLSIFMFSRWYMPRIMEWSVHATGWQLKDEDRKVGVASGPQP